jgi:16S rRNA (guanine527-N7)-methyltransferase
VIHELTDLLDESRQRGFLGPGPVERHLDHARAFVVAWGDRPDPVDALDLGAGGGLPGLVLAVVAWPNTRWVFLDAQAKRTEFLREAIEDLDLGDRVSVRTERAELTGRAHDQRERHELVVARSFGPPSVTVECAAPLLRPGGVLVVSEPPVADLLTRWPVDGLGMVGLGPARSVEVHGPHGPTHLAVMEQVEPCPERYPRRVGIPNKRPLF